MDCRCSQQFLDPFCFVESLVDAKSNLRRKLEINAARDLAAHITLIALERNKRYVRGEIARRVNLKFAPEIRFRVDERFGEAERIEKLLRTPVVQRDLKNEKESDGEKDES